MKRPRTAQTSLELRHLYRPVDRWQLILRGNGTSFTIGPECMTLQEAQDVRTAFKKVLFELQINTVNES